ncbi:MAG: hypothetical protein H7039_19840 [Bryobacteraceae bacterium]|nr:hypothetical protein [Bryobacteraceae bacterium]
MIRTIVLLVLFATGFSTTVAPACGPFFETAVFEPQDHPPAPDEYDKGRFGIVLGSYRVPHLVTAWRVLSGKTPEARRPVMLFSQTRPEYPVDRWLNARAEVVRTAPVRQISVDRRVPGHDFQTYVNCLDSAFENAALTLRDRVKHFGADAEGVRKWVNAQDTVFGNCADGAESVDPPEPGLQPLLLADRQYQIASALFYAGDFTKARSLWLAIANDAESPWREWSPYLAARCLVREATLGNPDEARVRLEKAEAELKALIVGSTDAQVRRSAEQIGEWVSGKLRPLDQMAMYARRLEGSAVEDSSVDHMDLDNLIHIWSLVDSDSLKPGAGSELLDWLFAMRGRMTTEEVIARWRREQSEVWLVAALQSSQGITPELIEAAAQVKPGTPAFATAVWARVRATQADANGRRVLLDSLLPQLRRTVPPAALNWFVRERLALARNFGEFVAFAPRRFAAEGMEGGDGVSFRLQEKRPLFLLDEDGAVVVNRFLPLSRWMAVIESGKWTAHLRERLVRAGFVRALAANDETMALALSKRLRTTASKASTLLADFEEAGDAETRRFAAAWAVLKLPGLHPEMTAGLDRKPRIERLTPFRDDWWCAPPISEERPVAPPAWVTEAELTQARKERAAGGGALPFVTPIVVEWANRHASDPRAPEALAMVVRASRYGCRDAATGKFSKQAFTLLHQKFPASSWAIQTPYWYDERYGQALPLVP